MRLANSRPNLRPHCRIGSCVTEMPRAASISSTHAQAQREPKIQPHRVADDFRGVAIASVNRVSSRRRHPARFPEQPGSYQVCSRPNLTVPYYLLCREALNDEAVADWLRDDHVN